jgi:DNA-binding response OmpR family regulator
MRILIAEDDVNSRTVWRAALTKQGHDVMATVDGADAHISTHADVRFSHSVCPDCMKTHYPDAV